MAYQLLIHPNVGGEIAAVALKDERDELRETMHALADSPIPAGAFCLDPSMALWKVSCGPHAIVYRVDPHIMKVTIVRLRVHNPSGGGASSISLLLTDIETEQPTDSPPTSG